MEILLVFIVLLVAFIWWFLNPKEITIKKNWETQQVSKEELLKIW